MYTVTDTVLLKLIYIVASVTFPLKISCFFSLQAFLLMNDLGEGMKRVCVMDVTTPLLLLSREEGMMGIGRGGGGSPGGANLLPPARSNKGH